MPVGKKPKTFVGVLASHDSLGRNKAIADIFNEAATDTSLREIIHEFRFVFTGGTYARLFEATPIAGTSEVCELSNEAKTMLFDCGVIRLPSTEKGGVTILASLITNRKISIIWPFFTPRTTHLLFPENLALLRLADQWRAKKIMNSGSVREWIRAEARNDRRLNLQEIAINLELAGAGITVTSEPTDQPGLYDFRPRRSIFPNFYDSSRKGNIKKELAKANVALISHDDMKPKMLDFVTDYEHELVKFKTILATGTTGRLIMEAAPRLAEEVHRYHSGPKGGDVEIATEILFGGVHVVIFFVDPLHPHPHEEDIRVIFGACMIHDDIRMLSNEMQARDWMDRLVRGT